MSDVGEPGGGPPGVAGHHLAVAVRVGVLGLDRVGEDADDGEVGAEQLVLQVAVLQGDAGLVADAQDEVHVVAVEAPPGLSARMTTPLKSWSRTAGAARQLLELLVRAVRGREGGQLGGVVADERFLVGRTRSQRPADERGGLLARVAVHVGGGADLEPAVAAGDEVQAARRPGERQARLEDEVEDVAAEQGAVDVLEGGGQALGPLALAGGLLALPFERPAEAAQLFEGVALALAGAREFVLDGAGLRQLGFPGVAGGPVLRRPSGTGPSGRGRRSPSSSGRAVPQQVGLGVAGDRLRGIPCSATPVDRPLGRAGLGGRPSASISIVRPGGGAGLGSWWAGWTWTRGRRRTRTQFRPSRFASYIARSAAATSVSGGAGALRHGRGDPQADGHPVVDRRAGVRQVQPLDRRAQRLGHGPRALDAGVGQEDRELLAAVAGDVIPRPPRHAGQGVGHAAQALVPARVAVVVVVSLEESMSIMSSDSGATSRAARSHSWAITRLKTAGWRCPSIRRSRRGAGVRR